MLFCIGFDLNFNRFNLSFANQVMSYLNALKCDSKHFLQIHFRCANETHEN